MQDRADDMAGLTLPVLLQRRAGSTPSAPAYCVKREGAWSPLGWADFQRGTERVAAVLAAHGIARGDRVGIVGPTSVEWEYLQMGALRAGANVVGIDGNYTDATLHELLRNVPLAALGVEDAATLARVPADVRHSLKLVASFGAPIAASPAAIALPDVVTDPHAARIDTSALPGPHPDDAAITVFSSGTTGTPKPIAYTHRQVLLAVDAIVRAYSGIEAGSRFACWLPLANLFQRIINFCAIEIGAASYMVRDPSSLVPQLHEIDPAILIGVPRFYERLQAGIVGEVGALPGFRGRVARWALALAQRQASHTASRTDRALSRIADVAVYSRIRGSFGTNLRYLVSGSAPMSGWLLAWYDTLGLPVYEAYGVSENIVPVAMNRPGARRPGTVGRPLPPNEVRLAQDGEILVRGPGVHAAAPSGDGYWRTGDLGRFDSDGFLVITGRKTDVFKTANGRWVHPQPIEAALRTVPYVDHAVAVGAGRPRVLTVASINSEALSRHAARRGIDLSSNARGELPADAVRLLEDDFAAANAMLPRSERPRAVLVVRHAFSVEGGELTTNLKLRRHAVEARFRQPIDDAYSALAAPHAAVRPQAEDRPRVFIYP